MRVVVDANVLIATLIKPGIPTKLYFSDELEIFAPKFLLDEIEHNMAEIQQKTRLSVSELDEFFEVLSQRITWIGEQDFKNKKETAEQCCPDIKDVPYFALALHLNCAVWSNEKRLRQDTIQVYATHELLELLRII